MTMPEAPRGDTISVKTGILPRLDRTTWILIAACFASCIVQVQVTIVNVALPQIAEGLQAETSDLQWIIITYTTSFAALLLSAGGLSDRLGATRVFTGGLALFGAMSLACALATSPFALNVARLFQGVGAALLVPSSLALIRAACGSDQSKFSWAIAIWAAVGGFSFAAGPVIGGLLVATAGWQSVFLINIIVCLAGLGVTLRNLPKDAPRAAGPIGSDWLGQVLVILGMIGWIGAATVAAQAGPVTPIAMALLGLAVIASVGFVATELRAASPILPLSLFRDSRFSVANAVGFLNNAAYTGIIFIIAIYLQNAVGYSSAQAGLAFLPLTATLFFANLISGWIIVRYGARLPMVLGGAIGAFGYLLLTQLNETSSFLEMLPGFFIIPLGLGLTVPAITTAVLASVESRQSGIASASLNTSRQIGSAVGVAGLGAMVDADSAERIVEALWFAGAISAMLVAIAFVSAIAMTRSRH